MPLMTRLLPRHMQIIYHLNWLHLRETSRKHPHDTRLLASVSLIDEFDGKRVRMGHLAFLGSHRVNGVSALHTGLMRQTIFRDLDALYPGRIVNETNGITFRRWLYRANPGLTALLVEACGIKVLDDPEALQRLERFAGDAGFLARLQQARRRNKNALAELVHRQLGVELDPQAMFDVQIKRIHEYKRQLLNLLETVALYRAMKSEPDADWVPRVKIFAGKAAASYARAKLIIKLANDIAAVVNHDPAVRGLLKVVFLPNYSVSLAQMHRAGGGPLRADFHRRHGSLRHRQHEACAQRRAHHRHARRRQCRNPRACRRLTTSRFSGSTTPEVEERRNARFAGRMAAAESERLRDALECIGSGMFSPDDRERFRPIVDAVLGEDTFMVAADFDAYWQAQRELDALWQDTAAWWRMSLLNTARMGWFSSDRTIRRYAADIWDVPVEA